jgi:site-specific recombinase XerD
MEIQKFTNRLRVNKQYAISTVKSYQRALEAFNKDIKKLSLNKRSVEDTSKLQVSDVEFFI